MEPSLLTPMSKYSKFMTRTRNLQSAKTEKYSCKTTKISSTQIKEGKRPGPKLSENSSIYKTVDRSNYISSSKQSTGEEDSFVGQGLSKKFSGRGTISGFYKKNILKASRRATQNYTILQTPKTPSTTKKSTKFLPTRSKYGKSLLSKVLSSISKFLENSNFGILPYLHQFSYLCISKNSQLGFLPKICLKIITIEEKISSDSKIKNSLKMNGTQIFQEFGSFDN